MDHGRYDQKGELDNDLNPKPKPQITIDMLDDNGKLKNSDKCPTCGEYFRFLQIHRCKNVRLKRI